MVLMKIFVAIILTKLQRFESRANAKNYAAGPEIFSPKRAPEACMVKTDVIFEVNVEFYPPTVQISPNPRSLFSHSAVWTCGTLALLSKRRNFVKLIATKIFIRAIFVKNFTRNIFCDLSFFLKVHISREN